MKPGPVPAPTGQVLPFHKNVLISLDGTSGKYRIKLAPGESFAAEIGQASAGSENNDVFMKTDTGAQTVQTLRGT